MKSKCLSSTICKATLMNVLKRRLEDWLSQSRAGRLTVEIAFRLGINAFFAWLTGLEIHPASVGYPFEASPYWYRFLVYCAFWAAVEASIRLYRMLRHRTR
jgi:hypothetical protein